MTTAPDEPIEDSPADTTTPAVTQPAAGEVDPALGPFVATAATDLAGRLGISADAITPIEAVLVIWPDGGLGCPQPGMEYKQVQVDGYRIVLAANGITFNYHGGGSRGPFLCEKADV